MTASAESTPSLFRPQVLEERDGHRLGKVLIHQPLAHHLAAVVAALLIAAIAAYACLGTYTRKATVRGLLMPEQGLFRLVAPSGGQITAVLTSEGQAVAPDQPLFQLTAYHVTRSGASDDLIREQLNQRLSIVRTSAEFAEQQRRRELVQIDRRLDALDAETTHLERELATLAQRERLSANQEDRIRKQADAGFVSHAQLEQAQLDRLALRQQQQGMQRARAVLERDRVTLLATREEIDARHHAQITEAETALSVLRQELAELESRHESISTAPFRGIVTGLHVHEGSIVTPGTLLASIIPEGEKFVGHLYAAEQKAGFLKPGQPVRIRLAAYPYQKYGMVEGKVTHIAQSPYALGELPGHIATAIQQDMSAPSLYYRVTVELDSQTMEANGQENPLRAGMVLEADIIQDTRRLYEWVLEPIYSMTGKMGNGAARR